MSITVKQLDSREEWLAARKSRIGGSEASAIIGMNPFMTNVDLWEIKTGKKEPADLSGNELVIYGQDAERALRELYMLDHPQYEVEYRSNNYWTNDSYPFAHASLDGWIFDQQGRRGILEIKTATIQNATQKAKWEDRIPDNYFVQLLWYMAVVEADFAELVAQLKWNRESIFKVTKHYRVNRADVEDEIKYLMQKGAELYDCIKAVRRPPLLLPEI